MAKYYVRADEDLSTVAAELLDAADDKRSVVYIPGDGPKGAFELPDSLAESYASKNAVQVQQDNDAEAERLRAAHFDTHYLPGPDEPTLEDLREEGQKTNAVGGTYEAPKPAVKRASKRTPAKSTTEE